MRFLLLSPQMMRSLMPSPARMTLCPGPPVNLSLPRSPFTVSSCLPPLTQSSPLPPKTRSLPSWPLRLSFLSLPVTRSAPRLANMASCLFVPNMESALLVPKQSPPSHRIVFARAIPLPMTITTATTVSKIVTRLTIRPPLGARGSQRFTVLRSSNKSILGCRQGRYIPQMSDFSGRYARRPVSRRTPARSCLAAIEHCGLKPDPVRVKESPAGVQGVPASLEYAGIHGVAHVQVKQLATLLHDRLGATGNFAHGKGSGVSVRGLILDLECARTA